MSSMTYLVKSMIPTLNNEKIYDKPASLYGATKSKFNSTTDRS